MGQVRVDNEKLAQWFPSEPLSEVQGLRDMAVDYIERRCRVEEGKFPPDLTQAVRLIVNRHLARRSSPDGTLGMSEFGVGRIATVDRDIEAMLAPHRKVVFG